MIADRYLERRFKEGWQEGFKLGLEQGRAESRQNTKEVLEQAGIELPPEVRERLFGNPDQDARR